MSALARSVAIATLLVSTLLTACVPTSPACDTPSLAFDLTITAREMTPSELAACRDNEITLTVTADEGGIFHLHGYDEEAPATELVAGEPKTIEFSTVHIGQFIIAFHTHDGDESDLGVLTVNEP